MAQCMFTREEHILTCPTDSQVRQESRNILRSFDPPPSHHNTVARSLQCLLIQLTLPPIPRLPSQ